MKAYEGGWRARRVRVVRMLEDGREMKGVGGRLEDCWLSSLEEDEALEMP